jgi:hypothetical protein
MPATLSSSDNYSYAIELSVDEAVAARASSVQFSQPVVLYVEDSLELGPGSPLSLGYYDRSQAVWVTESNGQVVAIASVNGGQASLDIDGDGLVDDHTTLASLGITDEER